MPLLKKEIPSKMRLHTVANRIPKRSPFCFSKKPNKKLAANKHTPAAVVASGETSFIGKSALHKNTENAAIMPHSSAQNTAVLMNA